MFKLSAVLLLSALALAVHSAPASDTPSLDDFKACAEATKVEDEKCMVGLPQSLKDSKDLHVLAAHPELCCPAFKALLCVEHALEKEAKCKVIYPLLKTALSTQEKVFTQEGCHLEKCK